LSATRPAVQIPERCHSRSPRAQRPDALKRSIGVFVTTLGGVDATKPEIPHGNLGYAPRPQLPNSPRYGFRPYVPVGSRRAVAASELVKLKKTGRPVAPVIIEGRKIARTFWGEAWCGNLELKDRVCPLP
jgi:hypothetical protein